MIGALKVALKEKLKAKSGGGRTRILEASIKFLLLELRDQGIPQKRKQKDSRSQREWKTQGEQGL